MLLLLALAATATAAPQLVHPYMGLPYAQQHVVYGHPGYGHPYGYPMVQYAQPAMTQYVQPAVTQYAQNGQARDIWAFSLSGLQTSEGDLTTTNSVCGSSTATSTDGTAGTTACTVTGEAIFSQNGIKDILCQNNAGLTVNLQGSGLKANNKYTLYVATDVALTAATKTKVVEFTAPIVGPGGVNLYFCTDGLNVDGAKSKTSVDGKYFVVQDTTSTKFTVGATENVLA